ncbi:MAG: TonB-dependent receptor, partial [Chitinophagaceae bacterium]|nr:TonB-dependent receptor [Chitinophagaceae bacterium]
MARLLLLLLLLPCSIFAQKNIQIKGVVYDTASKKGLAFATVSLVNAKDSTLINFTRADSNGAFILKQVSKGTYLLSTSYVGYISVWKNIDVTNDGELNIGNVAMTDISNFSDVTVNAKRPPVVINGDTLEFNAENFKTQPNAVVEDLLKRLPGVTVDADGTIRVNGQQVNRVFVNGKDFFNGDPKMATKNLDADAIDKVQVFDKKSDRSEFTGIDDGNNSKAINLKLKKDRNNAVFGRVAAGAGNNERYDAQSNLNKFKGNEQMSLIGMGNNTNKQGFSMSDVLNFSGELRNGMRNGGGITIRTQVDDQGGTGLPVTGLGQNQQGIATTFAGGLNYNNNFNHKKTDINASFTASDVDLSTIRATKRQYTLPGNNFSYISANASRRKLQQQRLNVSIDHKIDSLTSLKIMPSLTLQQQQNNSHNIYTSETNAKQILNDG